ncbi:hypothetical protein EFS27_03415 [Leuconostoc mesenteroides]|uniref:hypothetical protein n=1 Tax=Leuconostoc mesenteroides TaxID=1245 RepID=UPI0021A34A7A|nr:hypothetical protein [Leuconostoc mesenteroides]MCT3038348.1 hypothetical protein [Leuconostoc mesenteroides]
MKFTKDQYQKIVEIVNEYPDFGKEYIVPNGGEGEWSTTLKELITGIFGFAYNMENSLYMGRCMLALANPLTREWAHDKFVEKEKEFYWNSKKQDVNGYFARLYKSDSEMVSSYSMMKPKNNINSDEQLTESEIKAWGYNPEMFDREEVQ